jgi:radical SAM superfamily enzyme YgiQ (UPF0313 family)
MDSELKRLMSPSLAALTLAALTPNEHSVWIEDENTGKLNLNDQPDLVGITVNVDTSARAYEIAGHYRKRGIPVVLGGIHVSANPEEALQHADAVCVGEAELQWEKIINDAATGRMQRIYRNHKYVDTQIIKSPARDLITNSKYLYTNIIYTSRGCPFVCEFCYNSCDYARMPHRNRPISNVIQEIKSLDTKHVMFIDDNFIGNIGWTREFVKAIKPLGLTWNCAVSANIWQYPDLLDDMKQSGCKSLFIGFETINSESIAGIKKHQNKVDEYEKLINMVHDRGIMINASLVFGFDNDTSAVFRRTLDWLAANRIETMTAHILTPYPGTVIYKRFLDAGRIIDFNLEHYNTAHVVFEPANLTRDQLYRGYLWIYEEFYSLRSVLRRMPRNVRQWAPYLLFNFAYRKFGRMTSTFGHIVGIKTVGKIARFLSYGIR